MLICSVSWHAKYNLKYWSIRYVQICLQMWINLQKNREFDGRIIIVEWLAQFICFENLQDRFVKYEIPTEILIYPHRANTAVNMDRHQVFFLIFRRGRKIKIRRRLRRSFFALAIRWLFLSNFRDGWIFVRGGGKSFQTLWGGIFPP